METTSQVVQHIWPFTKKISYYVYGTNAYESSFFDLRCIAELVKKGDDFPGFRQKRG